MSRREHAVGNLTLYFILGWKDYLFRASKIIEEDFVQIKDGDAVAGIFDWFKKFRGDYRSEHNAVDREFDRWFKERGGK